MSDLISLRGLAFEARHGVLAQEKTAAQPFLVDIDLELPLSRAGRSDDLRHTVSYADVAHRAAAIVAGGSVDLIETLAARIAGECLRDAAVEAATVTVHKPQAPIGLPFADAAVTVRVEREAFAVIALGANLGAPAERLADAVRRIGALEGVEARALSPLVETDPVGGPPDQPVYLNAVLTVRTRLAPFTLLRRLQEIEAVHGRTREVRWGPRSLDLDLISYVDPERGGARRSDDPELTLPHPRAHERAFVMVPWMLADPHDPEAVVGWRRFVAGAEEPGLTREEPGTLTREEPEAPTRERAARHGVRPGPPWPPHVATTAMVTGW